MSNEEYTRKALEAFEAMPSGATYGLMINGPVFDRVPDVGRRIRLFPSDDGDTGWEYDDDAPHLVTGANRHRTAIEVRLQKI